MGFGVFQVIEITVVVVAVVGFFLSLRSLQKENTALLKEISDRSFREHSALMERAEKAEAEAREHRKEQALEHKEMLGIMSAQRELLARIDERLGAHVDEERRR